MVHRVAPFDIWQVGYQGAVVTVNVAGTTTPASLFTDEALSVAASNPQTLLTGTINGESAGKFTAPLYTASPYQLSIDTGETTGIIRPPITSLVAEDASKATVKVPSSARTNELEDIVARTVHAEDWGEIGAVAATNNTTITAAIGALVGGRGTVLLPGGTIPFTSLTLGEDVILEGIAQQGTTLTCTTGGNCVTLSGARSGMAHLTLDGISKVASSVGVFSKADQIIFDNVRVKRFETGIHCKGGFNHNWRLLFIEDHTDGVKLHGDVDSGGGSDGDILGHLLWVGGNVTNCTNIGLDLSYEDRQVYNNSFKSVGFSSNTGTAVNINGARATKFEDCAWSGNTTTLAVNDDSLTTVGDDNKVIGLHFDKCRIANGAATFQGTCQDVILEKCDIRDVDFTLTAPDNHILLKDSIEDSSVTIAGTGSDKIIRIRETLSGASSGTTTDGTPLKAWSISLVPGQLVYLEGKVIALNTNGTSRAIYHLSSGAYRPGSTLDYDGQTANFTLGEILTGGTSGATAQIIADADAGATGTLTLIKIDGEFQNNETITDPLGGSATVDGTLTAANAVLDTVGSGFIRTIYETDAALNAAFTAPGSSDIELTVTGAAANDIEWTAHVDVVSAS